MDFLSEYSLAFKILTALGNWSPCPENHKTAWINRKVRRDFWFLKCEVHSVNLNFSNLKRKQPMFGDWSTLKCLQSGFENQSPISLWCIDSEVQTMKFILWTFTTNKNPFWSQIELWWKQHGLFRRSRIGTAEVFGSDFEQMQLAISNQKIIEVESLFYEDWFRTGSYYQKFVATRWKIYTIKSQTGCLWLYKLQLLSDFTEYRSDKHWL